MTNLEPMPLFDVNSLKPGEFLLISGKYALDTKYGPLLTDTHAYLCPDCGGWGHIPSASVCPYCKGVGEIPLDDSRVVDEDPRRTVNA